ncbi:DUF418 domain-containing protein [Neptunicella marina]|uniref:DUF418 domain-containing protein n=1 Tax=Neptunicella marina TaxID=2125989 RepID=A0A8J6M038_9ALTE|nr:DUF418 domain-containing protein [Neptunicella marina]MBC3764647.1 DUF418 domain-containing protein [Neptunicella marina]
MDQAEKPQDNVSHDLTHSQPTRATERIQLLDILRGFALFGILLMNIEFFNRSLSAISQFDLTLQGWDWAAGWLIKVLVEGKFYKLFSLLFGMGFAIMLLKAQLQNRPFVGRFTRRMLALFVFGLAHMILLWSGDILHDYAVGGLVLLGWVCLIKTPRFKRFDSNKFFLKAGLLVLCMPFLVATIGGMLFGMVQDNNGALANAEQDRTIKSEADKRFAGYYRQYVAEHLDELPEHLQNQIITADMTDTIAENQQAGEVVTSVKGSPHNSVFDSSEILTEEPLQSATDSTETQPASAENDQQQAFEDAVEERLKTKAQQQFNQNKDKLGLLQNEYWQVTRFRATSVIDWLLTTPVFVAFFGLPLFMLGYWLIATNKMTQPEQHTLFFKIMTYVGLFCGLMMSTAGVLLSAQPESDIHPVFMVVATTLDQAGQLLLSAGYLGAVTLLCMSVKWHKRLAWLAPMGQMALTNYMMHSLVLSWLFYGYGGALFMQVSRFEQVILAFGILAFQAVFSLWWLRVFHFGPLEWVWRCITYWQWQPFKRLSAG